MALMKKNGGWIEVICGPMFSGKTEELIRRLIRAQIAKQVVTIFKPSLDDRYSEDYIVSHNKRKIKSVAIKNIQDIYKQSESSNVVGIDEAQFFDDELVTVCKNLAKNKTRVIIAGLDKDYKGLPFGPMPLIMCEADYLDKLRAICVKCSRSASYTKRISTEVDQVVIGELDKYEARCRKCFVDA